VATRFDLESWLQRTLQGIPGRSANIVTICRSVWKEHENELRNSGDLFYTWQYDIRWAANRLRRQKILKPVETSPKGFWELT